jgi:hypothetical protein
MEWWYAPNWTTNEEEKVSAGSEHYERRIAQQRAADKRRIKGVEDIDWKKEHQQELAERFANQAKTAEGSINELIKEEK